MKQKTQKKELRWLWAHSRPAAGGILLLQGVVEIRSVEAAAEPPLEPSLRRPRAS